jgi:CubicO group peptidase (beta-lactamase class C family)
MRASISFIAALLAFALGPFAAQTAFATQPASGCGIPTDIHDGWAITSPEKQGMNPLPLCKMDDGITAGKLADVDSIVVVRHGVLVYERYYVFRPHQFEFDPTTRHQGYSMTKSVVSLLVGIAMDRGLIKDIDAPVISYFPEGTKLLAAGQDRITLRHLLTMSAGLGSDRVPGVSFNYNNRETELVGAVLNKVTGKDVEALAREDIFTPLGITDVEWHKDASSGLPTSARGLELRPRDWAKIGQLVLNRGVWEGKQIVPASWIAQSTAEQIKAEGPLSAEQVNADGPRSYGYQWWRGRSPGKDHPVQWIAAMGFNSQKTLIIPALDMVVVFNASLVSKNMVTPELDLLDRYILPAISTD